MSWYEVTHFKWATKPEVEIRSAITQAAHKSFVELVEIDVDEGPLGIGIVISSAGKFARFRIEAGEIGAELVLDGGQIDAELKDGAIGFYVELIEELGDAREDEEVTAAFEEAAPKPVKIGPPHSVLYKAFDRDNVVVKSSDFPAKCLFDDNQTFAVLHDKGRMQLRVARVAFIETGAAGEELHRSEWRIDDYGRVIERTGNQGAFVVGGMRGRR